MKKIDGPAPAEMFSIQLLQPAAGAAITVPYAEVVRSNYRHRLTFTARNALQAVLAPDLADALQDFADQVIQTGPKVEARPDFTLMVGGLVLGGLRAIVSGANTDGSFQMTVRFRYFVGGIQNAFAASTYFDKPTLEHREWLGVRALEDVAMPLLDLAQTMRSQPIARLGDDVAEPLVRRLDEIEAQAADLEFYAGLLRRYVDNCGPERTTLLAEFADPVHRIAQMAEPPLPAYRPRRAIGR